MVGEADTECAQQTWAQGRIIGWDNLYHERPHLHFDEDRRREYRTTVVGRNSRDSRPFGGYAMTDAATAVLSKLEALLDMDGETISAELARLHRRKDARRCRGISQCI